MYIKLNVSQVKTVKQYLIGKVELYKMLKFTGGAICYITVRS